MTEKEKARLKQRTRELTGANWRLFNPYWKQLGGTIEPVPKTGERRYDHELLERPILVGRRKTVCRELTKWLRRIAAAL